MTIDNGPAIRAYCQERIKMIQRGCPEGNATGDAMIEELNRIIAIVNGLEEQAKVLNKALGL